MTAHVLLQHAELTAELIAFPSAYYTSAALYLGKRSTETISLCSLAGPGTALKARSSDGFLRVRRLRYLPERSVQEPRTHLDSTDTSPFSLAFCRDNTVPLKYFQLPAKSSGSSSTPHAGTIQGAAQMLLIHPRRGASTPSVKEPDFTPRPLLISPCATAQFWGGTGTGRLFVLGAELWRSGSAQGAEQGSGAERGSLCHRRERSLGCRIPRGRAVFARAEEMQLPPHTKTSSVASSFQYVTQRDVSSQ